MKKFFYHGRESKWWKITGCSIIVLALVLCLIGWRGLYQHNITQTLRDVYRQAKRADAEKGKSKFLTIHLGGEGKSRCKAQYRVAELSDEQFARLQGDASSWVEQARVTENVSDDIGSFCGVGMYHAEEWKDAYVYQIGGRSRIYLLVEDRSEGKEYVARLQNCYSESEEEFDVGEILKDFAGIREEGDISRITLEDTKEIEEGQSNILAVYYREEDKKELYAHLGSLPFQGDIEEEFLCSIFQKELTEEELREVKGDAYNIELENKQGETSLWKYQMTDEEDYLLMNDGDFAVGVSEEESIFWRQLFLSTQDEG